MDEKWVVLCQGGILDVQRARLIWVQRWEKTSEMQWAKLCLLMRLWRWEMPSERR